MNNSLVDLINQIEKETGPLSQAQLALLTTDGSVTRLLEIFCNAPVGIRTISQSVIPAPDDIADDLGVLSGEEVNYRIVDLYNKKTGVPLIHAISYAPLSHLPQNAIMRLMKEDEPIGYIMHDEKIESRREILSIYSSNHCRAYQGTDNNKISQPYISRSYRIIHNDRPIFIIEEQMPLDLLSERKTMRIKTPARLHLGLLDMNGSLGRVDGGVGITIDEPGFDITVSESASFSVSASNQDITNNVNKIIERLKGNGLSVPPAHIHVNGAVPFHCGLGSGTQLTLALTSAFTYLNQENMSAEERIAASGRGGTSGIGIRSFFEGGMIVDAGHSFGYGRNKTRFAPSSASIKAGQSPLVGRYPLPDSWNVIIAIANEHEDICGKREEDIFQACCPVPLEEVRTLAHLLLMKLIPSVIEEDLDEFGMAVNEMQRYGFKRCELDMQPQVIPTLIEEMRNAGAAGAGLSSFGPAVYGICDTNQSSVVSAAEGVMNEYSGGYTILTKGRNSGAEIIKIA